MEKRLFSKRLAKKHYGKVIEVQEIKSKKNYIRMIIALNNRKQIIIKNYLPFILREINQYYHNVHILDAGGLQKFLEDKIVEVRPSSEGRTMIYTFEGAHLGEIDDDDDEDEE